jgi:flavin-dependent dehydrogenase
LEYDVLIAGAGPAGCSAAGRLSALSGGDFKIMLADCSAFPRSKVCGGVLLEKSKDILRKSFPRPPDSIFAEPKSLSMRITDFDNGTELEVRRDFLNVRRAAFDAWLLGTVEEKADFFPQSRVENIRNEKGAFVSLVKSGSKTIKVKTRNVIDATGAHSAVRSSALGGRGVYIACQERIKGARDDFFDFMLSSKLTDYYVWGIPKDGYTLVGTAFKPGGIREKILRFRKFVREEYGLKGKPQSFESMIILRPGKHDVMLSKNGILMAGEAAGLISPVTGEGISFALASGRICADAIKKSPDNPCESYERLCSGLVGDIAEKSKISSLLGSPESRKAAIGRMFEK